MGALEHDDYGDRLSRIYAEQVAGLRQQVSAVDRNVLKYIAEGRERGEQIDAVITQLGVCAQELGSLRKAWDDFKSWQRILLMAGAASFLLLFVGMAALLVKVF